MNKLLPIDKLERMVGKSFVYNQDEHKIIKYEFAGGSLIITSDKQDIIFSAVDYRFHLKEFLPIDDKIAATTLQLNVANQSVMTELKDVLLDNIRKVKENKDYIPQAQEINSQVKSMIDLARTEIDFIKIVNKV